MSTDELSPMMKVLSWRGPSRSIQPGNKVAWPLGLSETALTRLPYDIKIEFTQTGVVLSVSAEATEAQLAEVLRALRLSKL